MTFSQRLAALPLLGALAVACAEAPVRRVVTLAPEAPMPAGSTTVVGTSLRLELAGLEPLSPGRRLYAWVSAGGAWAPLAEVALGANKLSQPSWEAVDELLVTDEGEALGPTPNPLVMFRGPLGGNLPFEGAAGPTDQALREATVELVLEDYTLTARVDRLPSLTTGAYWGVWLLGEEVAGEEQEASHLGRLDGDDTLLTFEELLADHHEAVLTLELENGLEAMGTPVMHGKVLSPAALATPRSDAHSPH